MMEKHFRQATSRVCRETWWWLFSTSWDAFRPNSATYLIGGSRCVSGHSLSSNPGVYISYLGLGPRLQLL